MKTIGIIGGIGPESTIDYYRAFIASYREKHPEGGYPSILINSIDLDRMIRLIAANDLEAVTDILVSELQRLDRAGAQLGLIAANTPHIVFDEVHRLSPIPLVSIVEATCEAALRLKLNRPGLIGTRFTMQATFYPTVFSRAGLTLTMPGPDQQQFIHDTYLSELVRGVFLPETRKALLQIIETMHQEKGIDGLILGGTELPLILGDAQVSGVTLLDTTRIHVARTLQLSASEGTSS